MKSKAQLKEELHKLIDSIEDEDILNTLNDDVVPYLIENKFITQDDEELTPEQQIRLQVSIQQAEEGKVISLDEFYRKMEQWRTK